MEDVEYDLYMMMDDLTKNDMLKTWQSFVINALALHAKRFNINNQISSEHDIIIELEDSMNHLSKTNNKYNTLIKFMKNSSNDEYYVSLTTAMMVNMICDSKNN